jgi:DNA-binding NtrC family response regulator
MKLGADDYLSKNCGDEELLIKVQSALEKVRLQRDRFVAEQHEKDDPDLIIGEAPEIKKILKQVDRLADKDETVLILGEAGTGKELIARRLHEQSTRKKNHQPFIALNCAAIPAELAESVLFGHERGAFTGAHQRQPGKLEVAEQGTLFLDEVDCLPINQQTKFLRALETRIFERVGGNRPIRLRARVAAAAKDNLPEAVAAGKFRADLFYRLNVITFAMPPLRKRPEDIPLLADYFCQRFSRKNGLTIEKIDEAAMAVLLAYRWPGNVRELRHEFERILALAEADTRCLTLDMLSAEILQAVGAAPKKIRRPEDETLTLRQARMLLERQMIDEALQQTNGNVTRAAEKLGLTRRGLQKILQRHGRAVAGEAE